MTDISNKLSPVVVWTVAAGAAASGLSGIGSMGQLNDLQTVMEEQVRVAELRGQLLADLAANRFLINENRTEIQKMITKEGALELHRAQQLLIERLIDWTENTVTKSELQLAVGKMRNLVEQTTNK